VFKIHIAENRYLLSYQKILFFANKCRSRSENTRKVRKISEIQKRSLDSDHLNIEKIKKSNLGKIRKGKENTSYRENY
jgi:hypothetical protein